MSSSLVFSIPELLEAILIAYAHTSFPGPGNPHPTQNSFTCPLKHQNLMSPVLSLFPLQRVSRAFSTQIQTSPSLRALMGLPLSSQHHESSVCIDPLNWFLHTLGLPSEVRKDDCYTIYANPDTVWKVPGSAWLREEASWRKMKTFAAKCMATEEAIELDLVISEGCFGDRRNLGLYPWPEKIRPEAMETLGEVYGFVAGVEVFCAPLIKRVEMQAKNRFVMKLNARLRESNRVEMERNVRLKEINRVERERNVRLKETQAEKDKLIVKLKEIEIETRAEQDRLRREVEGNYRVLALLNGLDGSSLE